MEPLTVPGKLETLGAIANYVLTAAQIAELDPSTAYDLRLAVDEIVTNIIVHGYNEVNRTGNVDLQAKLDEQTLTIFIEDTGLPFDPTQKPLPRDLHLPIDQRQTGGLGVYLALEGVDRFAYERVGERNRNILVVQRSR